MDHNPVKGGWNMVYTYKLDEKGIPYRASIMACQGGEGDSDVRPHDGQLESFHLYMF